uniref:Uncharacterized protein n=1 Tax=Plectus sambesii TaxID=2011161 RepID=A0A914VYA0_9BILA
MRNATEQLDRLSALTKRDYNENRRGATVVKITSYNDVARVRKATDDIQRYRTAHWNGRGAAPTPGGRDESECRITACRLLWTNVHLEGGRRSGRDTHSGQLEQPRGHYHHHYIVTVIIFSMANSIPFSFIRNRDHIAATRAVACRRQRGANKQIVSAWSSSNSIAYRAQ